MYRSCPYNGDFKCNDGKCLRSYDVCDGSRECVSGEDEQNCSKLNFLQLLHTKISSSKLAGYSIVVFGYFKKVFFCENKLIL